MKKVLIGLLALSSISALASNIAIKVREPVYSGTNYSLSAESDKNGVCLSLGFEKALEGSARQVYYGDGSGKELSVKISPNGTGEELVFSYRLTSITCVNRTQIYPNERATLLHYPIHPETSQYFSGGRNGNDENASSETGICKSLGYRDALFDSGVIKSHWDGSGRVRGIKIDKDGSFKEVLGYTVLSVVCID